MPNGGTQAQFDGQNPVAGYTLFQGKDGTSFYLKGENLSDALITQKVAAARQANAPPGPSNPKPGYGAANLGTPGDVSTGPEGSNPDSRLMSPQSQREASIRAPLIAAAGVGAGAGMALAAPTATAGTAGTGILDAAGQEITREITQYGPSLGAQGAKAAIGWVARHKLLSAIAYEGARRAGVPLPNVLGWIAKAAME